MKIAVLWTGFSGYSAACWRRLAGVPGVELRVHTINSGSRVANTGFEPSTVDGLNLREHSEASLSATEIRKELAEYRPDLTLVAGWGVDAYNTAVHSAGVQRGRLVVAVDNPWKCSLKQRVAGLLRRRFLASADAVLVPGERARQFVRTMGVPLSKIHDGMYGFDEDLFSPRQLPAQPPSRFLFVGRYVPEKGIDLLLRAHAIHLARAVAPWGLRCSGTGPLRDQINATSGVEDAGFNQPEKLRELIEDSAALVLPSFSEHWGVIVAEALGSGRPVICSDTTGSIPDLLRDRQNGLVFEAGNAGALAEAMTECASDVNAWRRWAIAAPNMTAAFTSTRWAEAIVRIAQRPNSP